MQHGRIFVTAMKTEPRRFDAVRRHAAAMPVWLQYLLMSLALPPIAALLLWYARWWMKLFDMWPGVEFLPRT